MATLATNTRPVALGTVAESRPSPRVTGKRECAKTSQRESWTKTALGHAQVRREGRVSCASRLRTWSECDGGSNNDCCRCFKRARSQRSESKGGADAPQMGVFSHAETIHQVMSLIINTTGVGENRRGGRRKNMKEHAVSIRRSERAQPTASRRIVKKNGNERTQQQEQSGQETKTAKVSLSGEARRTDELVTAERDDREARIAATGGVKTGNATSGPREKQRGAVQDEDRQGCWHDAVPRP